jgi:hypothetical protein
MNNACPCTAILVPRSDDQTLYPAVFVLSLSAVSASLYTRRERQGRCNTCRPKPRRGVTLFTHARVPLLVDYGYHTHA